MELERAKRICKRHGLLDVNECRHLGRALESAAAVLAVADAVDALQARMLRYVTYRKHLCAVPGRHDNPAPKDDTEAFKRGLRASIENGGGS